MASTKSHRLRFVLVAPRIPVNVGSCLRTAAALNADLALVQPLGFALDHKSLRRSSVGYWDDVKPSVFRDADHFWSEYPATKETQWIWATKYGERIYNDLVYGHDVVILFGNEEEGIGQAFFDAKKRCQSRGLAEIQSCRIPMSAIRCLNLSVSVGICGYEVVRQWGWKTLEAEALGKFEEITEN